MSPGKYSRKAAKGQQALQLFAPEWSNKLNRKAQQCGYDPSTRKGLRELAAKTGLSESTLCRIFNGSLLGHHPRTLFKLMAELKLTIPEAIQILEYYQLRC